MIRLKQARFTNFRLLRDVVIPFSTDPSRRLTVIRADNESGKTTALRGLQWALFGNESLPAGGGAFRLHPIDLKVDQSTVVPINVELVFEQSVTIPYGGGTQVETYRLTRSTAEEVMPLTDTFRRHATTLELVRLTDAGERPVANPNAILSAMVPTSLRDVFFTDGDRTLTFIETTATTSTRRQRVEAAIRSLLGLDVLESAIGHVGQVKSDLNSEGARVAQKGRDHDGLRDQLARLESHEERQKADLEQARATLLATDDELRETRKSIEAAIAKGGADKEQLVRRKNEADARVRSLRSRLADLRKEQGRLTSDSSLGFLLATNAIEAATTALGTMKDRGEIPKNFSPLLEERLDLGECICGSSLASGTDLRRHVEEILVRQAEQDEVRGHLMDLLYVARPWLADEAKGRWVRRLESLYHDFAGAQRDLERNEKEVAELQARLNQIGDTQLPELRKSESSLVARNNEAREQAIRLDTALKSLGDARATLERQLEKELKISDAGKRIQARRDVASDLQATLEAAFGSIRTEKVDEVSSVTSELFMQMIKADPETALIRGCTVTREFDIKVFGPHGRSLDPDRDLNGASRRALTLAFVMALTRVSGVEAPLVIDTPLGMMGPEIKREVLRVAIENAGQVVLFLTRSEIRDIEPQLDAYAGASCTMTNSSHYPAMLKYKPPVDDLRTIVCRCSHAETCEVCERRDDVVVLSDEVA